MNNVVSLSEYRAKKQKSEKKNLISNRINELREKSENTAINGRYCPLITNQIAFLESIIDSKRSKHEDKILERAVERINSVGKPLKVSKKTS